MRITELNISEFGCLKGVKISPDERMNIIYGENESGKSTVLLFIKFMLYGLGRRSAANSERERSVSWSGHTAAGSMTFYHKDKQYRIERRFVEAGRGSGEKLSVICLDDGEELSLDKEVGEYFLGVPKEVFESSACVGQMRSAEINGEKTALSIQNMLSSADENVDTARILKQLDAVRVEYRHKNRTGGSLFEDEQRIDALRQRLERSREATLSLDEWQRKLDAAKRDCLEVERDLESKESLLSEINKINIIRRFEKLKEEREEKAKLQEQKKELEATNLKTDFFPNARHTAELSLSAESLSDALANYETKKAQFDNKQEETCDQALAALGEKLEMAGGSASVLGELKEKQAKKKTQDITIALVWGLQAILSVVGALILVGGQAFGAALFSFVAPAVLLTVRGAKIKRSLDARIKEISNEYGAEPDMLEERFSLALRHLALFRSNSALVAKLSAELAEAERIFEKSKSSLAELLAKTLPDAEPTYETAMAEQARLEAFLSQYAELSKEEETLQRIILTDEYALSGYSEEAVRCEITVDLDEITPTAIAEAEKMRNFLASKKKALERRVSTLNDTVIELRANAEDPLPIADELAMLQEKYAKDSDFYSALTMAMESIEQAGQVMRGSVIPAISDHAGKIMGRISAEKYSTLRTTSTLGLSLDSDGFGVKSDFLSAGTRDAAYLALRIALFMRIYGEDIPPLILDEALCQFDDVRAERMLCMLNDLAAEGIQCLVFTSHKREGEIYDRCGVEYQSIKL